MERYRTIVADPPWPGSWAMGERAAGASSGSKRRYDGRPLDYRLMSLDEIHALPVDDIAEPDAHLYLWIPDRLLIEGAGASVMRAWGFQPGRTIIWWAKRSHGGGRFPRAAHEAILLGRRGDLPYNPINEGSVQEWRQVYVDGAKLHSAKPDGMLDLVERASPGPYCELFARRARFGWDYWGDESLNTAEMPEAVA